MKVSTENLKMSPTPLITNYYSISQQDFDAIEGPCEPKIEIDTDGWEEELIQNYSKPIKQEEEEEAPECQKCIDKYLEDAFLDLKS